MLARAGVDPKNWPKTLDQPIEYWLGQVEFCGLSLKIDQRALIPRIETEQLVELVVEELKRLGKKKTNLHTIDVGTGSGAIITALAKNFATSENTINFWAIDVSLEALELARENAASVQTKINFLESDLLANQNLPKKFDLIVANLPYIPSKRMPNLPKSVKSYEPLLALDGGKLGLELIEKLSEQALNRLTADGVLWLEIDDSHTQKLLAEHLPAWQIETFVDENGRQRYARLIPRP